MFQTTNQSLKYPMNSRFLAEFRPMNCTFQPPRCRRCRRLRDPADAQLLGNGAVLRVAEVQTHSTWGVREGGSRRRWVCGRWMDNDGYRANHDYGKWKIMDG